MTGSSRLQDPVYLLHTQYRQPNNLSARIALHERFSTNPVGIHSWLLERSRELLPDHLALLELGCGEGRLWRTATDVVPPGWQLTLTDFSPGMLNAAQAGLAGLYPEQVQFRLVDACEIPFADSTYDAVFAHFVLHHIQDRPKAFREIRRVLKPGGWLFASTLGKNHMMRVKGYAAEFEGREAFPGDIPFHLDNGAENLQQFFDQVHRLDYEDSLLVNEVEPLVDYVLSMTDPAVHTPARIGALRKRITGDLEAQGVIAIEKQSGLFICRKAEDLA